MIGFLADSGRALRCDRHSISGKANTRITRDDDKFAKALDGAKNSVAIANASLDQRTFRAACEKNRRCLARRMSSTNPSSTLQDIR